MDLFMAIALLCQTSTGINTVNGITYVDQNQLDCQKYYVECFYSSNAKFQDKLKDCITNRKAIN